jgi:DNA-binding transcriptional LysR family regulator
MDHRYRKFLAVLETGSFSEAAKKLHVSQPAITLAVASLEHSLGVKLYVRRRAPMELTTEGRLVADSARVISDEDEKLHHRLQQTASIGHRQIGLIDSIAHLLYKSPYERTLLSGVEVMVDNSRRIIRDLTAGKIELGVITGQPLALGPEVAVRKLHGEEFVFVTTPQRVLEKTTTRIDDWLATNPDSTSYRYFTKLFSQKGLQVTPIFYSASMELLRDMALSGTGTALLPRHIVQDSLDVGTLAIVKTKPLYRPIWVVTRHGDGSPEAKTFAAQIGALLAIR